MPQRNVPNTQEPAAAQLATNLTGAQSIMQPGFAGTDPQEVRQDIQNDPNGQITSREAGHMNEKK